MNNFKCIFNILFLLSILFNCIIIIPRNTVEKKIIRSQNISISDFKNFIKVPNYLIFNGNIINEFSSFIKTNIFSILYNFSDKDAFLDYKNWLMKKNNGEQLYNYKLNNEAISRLKNLIDSHLLYKYSWFFLSNDVTYSRALIRLNSERINDYFKNIGFLDSKVVPDVSFYNNNVYVSYNVYEGEIYRINSTNVISKNVEINDIIKKELKSEGIVNGSVFNQSKLNEFKKKCVNKIQNKGYYNFNISNLDIYVYKDALNYNVDVFFHTSDVSRDIFKKYKFGDIIFEYQPYVTGKDSEKKRILYKIVSPVYPWVIKRCVGVGNLKFYKKKVVNDIYVNLSKLDLFKDINISSRSRDDFVDFYVNLVLKKRFSAEYFMEFDINTKNINIVNKVSFLLRNLFKMLEIFKLSVEYSKVVPFKLSKFSFLKQYKFKSGLNLTYPFSFIFRRWCRKTELNFSFNNLSLIENKNKNSLQFFGFFSYLFNFMKGFDFSFKLVFLNIQKVNKLYTQEKSLEFVNNLNLKDIYIHSITLSLIMAFKQSEYNLFYKVLFSDFYRPNLNFLLKVEYQPMFKIKIYRYFEMYFKFRFGDIFSLNDKIPSSTLFQLGGKDYLRAWDLGEVGPGYTKKGKGNILFASSFEFVYNFSESLHLLFFIDSGNIWAKGVKNSISLLKDTFAFSKNLLKQLYLNGGLGVVFFTGVLRIRLDVAFKIYEPTFKMNDIFKIRFGIN